MTFSETPFRRSSIYLRNFGPSGFPTVRRCDVVDREDARRCVLRMEQRFPRALGRGQPRRQLPRRHPKKAGLTDVRNLLFAQALERLVAEVEGIAGFGRIVTGLRTKV